MSDETQVQVIDGRVQIVPGERAVVGKCDEPPPQCVDLWVKCCPTDSGEPVLQTTPCGVTTPIVRLNGSCYSFIGQQPAPIEGIPFAFEVILTQFADCTACCNPTCFQKYLRCPPCLPQLAIQIPCDPQAPGLLPTTVKIGQECYTKSLTPQATPFPGVPIVEGGFAPFPAGCSSCQTEYWHFVQCACESLSPCSEAVYVLQSDFFEVFADPLPGGIYIHAPTLKCYRFVQTCAECPPAGATIIPASDFIAPGGTSAAQCDKAPCCNECPSCPAIELECEEVYTCTFQGMGGCECTVALVNDGVPCNAWSSGVITCGTGNLQINVTCVNTSSGDRWRMNVSGSSGFPCDCGAAQTLDGPFISASSFCPIGGYSSFPSGSCSAAIS